MYGYKNGRRGSGSDGVADTPFISVCLFLTPSLCSAYYPLHTHTHTPAAHKQVTSNTNVHNISIDGKSGLVEISGPSPGSVQAAREEMDVKQEDVELSKDEAVAMLRDYR